MRAWTAIILGGLIASASASVFPSEETQEEWQQRIQAKIDLNRKSDVTIRIPKSNKVHGDIQIRVNQTRGSFPLGTAMVPLRLAECQKSGIDNDYCTFARENYNYAVDEYATKWRAWEPEYNTFDTKDVDYMLDWLEKYGFGIRAHCLFWDVEGSGLVPDWVFGLRGPEMVDAIHHRIETAMPHFNNRVEHWDINNEMLHGTFFQDSTYDPDIRYKMFKWVEEHNPGPARFVNDYDIFVKETDNYIDHIHDLQNGGASIDGIGIQGHMGPETINLAQVEDSLNKIWNEFHLPIWITEFDWNGATNGDHTQHAIELENFYNLCMSHEGVKGIIMWGFWDQSHWRPDAAIATGPDVTPNAAGLAYINLYQASYKTHVAVSPQEKGDDLEFTFRAFHGDFNVELVDGHGKTITVLDQQLKVEDSVDISYTL